MNELNQKAIVFKAKKLNQLNNIFDNGRNLVLNKMLTNFVTDNFEELYSNHKR